MSASKENTTNNDEYLAKVREAFYKKIRNTNWEDEYVPSKPRGRKPKPKVRLESRPRSEGERRAAEAAKGKFFNFN